MAEQGITERNVAGRTRTFQFAEPTDNRPLLLADNMNGYGMFWQEWEHGIGGSKPAKLWTDTERGSNSKFGRRKPIYLLLNRLINVQKKLPAEAFRLMDIYFPGKKCGAIEQEIRIGECNRTMFADLADPNNPLPVKAPKKRKRRDMQ